MALSESLLAPGIPTFALVLVHLDVELITDSGTIASITSRRGDLAAVMRDGIVISMTTSIIPPVAGSLLSSTSA
jgi:hypothetical protein